MPDKPFIETITVKANGQKQDVVIAMTQEEANDRSYREYVKEAQVEKTTDYLNKHPVKTPDPVKREELRESIKEQQEYNRRKSVNRRYF